MERTTRGIYIHAPKGKVLLRKTRGGLRADYQAGPLVNGTATAYARKIRMAVLEYARGLELPWSTGPDGQITIRDQRRYYEQTFNRELSIAETLLRWESLAKPGP